MSDKNPVLDFLPESPSTVPDPWPASRQWIALPPPTRPIDTTLRTIDTTSRVISFVLGFALASLIAWLGSIRGEETTATPITEAVVPAVIPVVTPATVEKKDAPPVAVVETAQPSVNVAQPVVQPTPPAPPEKTTQIARAPQSAAASGYRGILMLNSTPEGAEVLLNGAVVGQTPVMLTDLPIGSRAVVVRREGYSPWSSSVRIVANQRTTVQATLAPTQYGP